MLVDDDPMECLDAGPDGEDCRGPVRMFARRAGTSWPRCTTHQEARERSRETSMELYADSDVEPDWFDPSYAGERWSDD